MRVAVVIPAFNESATVAEVAEHALRYTPTVYVAVVEFVAAPVTNKVM